MTGAARRREPARSFCFDGVRTQCPGPKVRRILRRTQGTSRSLKQRAGVLVQGFDHHGELLNQGLGMLLSHNAVSNPIETWNVSTACASLANTQ